MKVSRDSKFQTHKKNSRKTQATEMARQTSQKIEGGPFREIFLKKSRTTPKKLKGDHLVLYVVPPGIVCYKEKKEKAF